MPLSGRMLKTRLVLMVLLAMTIVATTMSILYFLTTHKITRVVTVFAKEGSKYVSIVLLCTKLSPWLLSCKFQAAVEKSEYYVNSMELRVRGHTVIALLPPSLAYPPVKYVVEFGFTPLPEGSLLKFYTPAKVPGATWTLELLIIDYESRNGTNIPVEATVELVKEELFTREIVKIVAHGIINATEYGTMLVLVGEH